MIFVNSISMGLPGLAHKDLFPRIKRKLKSYSKLARETEEGITVVSPASLPFLYTSPACCSVNSTMSKCCSMQARASFSRKTIGDRDAAEKSRRFSFYV